MYVCMNRCTLCIYIYIYIYTHTYLHILSSSRKRPDVSCFGFHRRGSRGPVAAGNHNQQQNNNDGNHNKNVPCHDRNHLTKKQ